MCGVSSCFYNTIFWQYIRSIYQGGHLPSAMALLNILHVEKKDSHPCWSGQTHISRYAVLVRSFFVNLLKWNHSTIICAFPSYDKFVWNRSCLLVCSSVVCMDCMLHSGKNPPLIIVLDGTNYRGYLSNLWFRKSIYISFSFNLVTEIRYDSWFHRRMASGLIRPLYSTKQTETETETETKRVSLSTIHTAYIYNYNMQYPSLCDDSIHKNSTASTVVHWFFFFMSQK